MNFLAQKRPRNLLHHTDPDSQKDNPFNNFYYKDVAELTKAGGWNVDFKEKKSSLDPQARKILRTPDDYAPSLRTGLDFYTEPYKSKATEAFMACSMGTPFSIVVKMCTYDNEEFWASAMGRPMYDVSGMVYGIQGVFQNINKEKLKEIGLENSMKIIESQNSRLFNFAHIVSHNLRSHASNLFLTLELLKSINSPEEEQELKGSLFDISASLNNTINHLNEIVTAQFKSLDEQRSYQFDDALQTVLHSINRLIEDNDAEIFSDFSEVPEINYIPSYLESILLNLITNAIKYRHPDRHPVIDICSYTEAGRTCLLIKDNGLGIDLEKYGTRIFNLYQTFHEEIEAVGIGLFIIKNQIETLQGSIEVESTVDEGTTFTIKF
jgi:signal transduction histidine kinase